MSYSYSTLQITYCIAALLLTTTVFIDWLSTCLLVCTILHVTGVLTLKYTILINQCILICDCLTKIFLNASAVQYQLDTRCFDQIQEFMRNGVIGSHALYYVGFHVFNFYACLRLVFVTEGEVKCWGPLMTQIMTFLLPILMYTLSLSAVNPILCIGWALAACLKVMGFLQLLIHISSCFMIAYTNINLSQSYKIQIGHTTMQQQNLQYTLLTIMCLIVVLLNVSQNPHPEYIKIDRHKSSQIKTIISKRSELQAIKSNKQSAVLTILASVVLCLVTNSLGNILILLGVFTNIPNYKPKRFSYLMGIGLIMSVVLQPRQISYFLYIYIVVKIIGEDIKATIIVQFQMHSFGLMLNLYRIYLMLNHVSFLNFIIGLCRSSSVVLLTLAIRISFRYLNISSVFLGTNDNYGLETQLISLQSLPDAILWIYLILMCLNSPTAKARYSDTKITNILIEYPIVNRFSTILKCLKIFNWLSYTIFSFLVLLQIPSLYITIHMVLWITALFIDLKAQESDQQTNKSSLLRIIWDIVFYFTCIMIFTKYFFLLKQYDDTSDLIQTILNFLDAEKHLLGLSNTATSGFGLALYFVYDIAIMLLSWVNIYILNFKIYAAYRDIIVRNQNLSVLLNEEKQFTQEEQELLRKRNIYYFYNMYIRPIDMKAFLRLPENQQFQHKIRDCIMGLTFTVVMLGYYFQGSSAKLAVQIPFFFFFGLFYFMKYTKQYNPSLISKILSLLTIWSLTNLFFGYLVCVIRQIFWAPPSSVFDQLIMVYLVTIFLMVADNLYGFVPQISVREYQNGYRTDRTIIKLLLPFQIKDLNLYREILNLVSSFSLALSFSFFLTNIFSPDLISTILHPLIVATIFFSRLHEGSQQKWMYILSLTGLFDLWNQDFTAYFTIMSVSLFYCVRFQENWVKHKIHVHNQDNQRSNVAEQKQKKEQQIDVSKVMKRKKKKRDQKWLYYMCYCTCIWLMPILFDLIWLLGIVWLSPSPISALLIILLLPKLIYQLMFERAQWLKYVFYATLLMATLFFTFQMFSFYHKQVNSELYTDFFDQGFGIFLIFSAYFSYFIIIHKNQLYIQRSQEAKDYWETKKQMIGQLGSQLHNEKKLLLLEKIYHAKQRLSEKVNKISIHLRQHGKQPFYQSLDNMSRQQNQEEQYQLYSNMLLVLSKNTLQRCFLMLNQYIPPKLRKGNVFETAKEFRLEILRDYRGSFKEAFMKLKTEYMQEEQQQNLRPSSKNSQLGIEKISEINRLYKQCYYLISSETLQFNPILRYIIQNMEIIAMGIVVGWNLFGGVYTIPSSLAIFGWAIVLENKTTVFFWLSIMFYAGFILILKQIFMYFTASYFFQFVFYYHADDYLYEYLVIFISVSQIIFLQLGGTQQKSYSQRESIYDSFYRTALNKAGRSFDLDRQQEFMQIYKNLKQPSKHSFIYRVFSKARFKPGKDFYPLMSGIQLILLLYTFFFYDLMEFQSQKNRKSIGELLTINQFSSHMVIVLFIQIMIMVIDRLLVSLNLVDETNQALENFFLSFSFNIGKVKHDPPKQIDNISIFDALLIVKYLFHLTLLFAINFFVYFYIPSAGLSKSLIPSCNNTQCSKSYVYLSIFLLLYLMYFMVSGLQIKHGFNRNKCKNVLMEKYHYVNYYVYKAFTGIPFAWEFKKICDWTVTSTALPLFHWMKFEDINAKMYQSKCQSEMIKNKPLGAPWNKYILGPLGFLSILLLIFGPILMYSPANPFSIKDKIIGAEAKLFLSMNNRYDYNFFSTSHSIIKDNVDNDYKVDLTDKNLYYVKMSEFPDQNFLFSEPAVQKLNFYISKAIHSPHSYQFKFVFQFKIIEQEGGESIIEWATKSLNSQQLKDLHRMLSQQTDHIILKNFFSPFPGEVAPQSILLRTPDNGEYYEVSIVTKNKKIDGQKMQVRPVYFYYLTSNKFQLGFGIVTFYLTYVLLISRLLRFYLTDSINSTLYDGCYLQGILMLCEAVRQARIVENFIKEQSFYFELIDLMRHPKVFKQISGDFADFRKKYI